MQMSDPRLLPRGVLPHVTLTGTCGPIGYGFQGTVLNGVSISSLSVLNRVSLHDLMAETG